MKCSRCGGTGVEPGSAFTDDEVHKIAKGIFNSPLTQEAFLVSEEIREKLDESGLSKTQQKYVLAELGAFFPTVRRQVQNIHIHLMMGKDGKLKPVEKLTPEQAKALAARTKATVDGTPGAVTTKRDVSGKGGG